MNMPSKSAPKTPPVKSPRATATITLYKHARTSTPEVAADLSWPELCDTLEEEAQRLTGADASDDVPEQKRAMLSWSPHRLRDGTTRANENVEAVTALAIDVDDCDPEAIAAALRRNKWAGLIYESASSTPEAPRVRVVSPIDRELSPDECRATRLAYAEGLGLEPSKTVGVDRCLDASRVFFMGRLHGTPERRTWRVSGKPVQARALPPPALAWGAERRPAVTVRPLDELPPGDAGIVAALGDWQLHDGRKWDLCGAIGGELRRHGFGPAKCEAVVREWLAGSEAAGVKIDDGVRWALGAWDKPAHMVSGLETLAGIVGAEHAALIDGAVWRSSFAGKAQKRRREEPRAAGKAAPTFGQPVASDDANGDDADPLGRIAELSKPIEPLRYLCRGLGIAWAGKVVGVHGYAGSSKGLFMSLLALGAASGSPVFGHAVERVPVIYLDAETGVLAETRVKRLALGLGIDLGALERERWFRFRHVDRPLLEILSAIELEARAFDRGAGVVIACDSFSSMTPGEEVSSAYADGLWELGRLGNRAGAVPMVTLHERKQDRGNGRPVGPLEGISGTNRLAAALATSLRLTPSEGNDREILVTCTRAPETRFEPFRITWTDGKGEELSAACEAAHVATGREKEQAREAKKSAKKQERVQLDADAIETALRAAGCPLNTRAARSAASLDSEGWKRGIAECLRRGTVRSQPAGSSGVFWVAPRVEEVQIAGCARMVPAKASPPADPDARRARFREIKSAGQRRK